MSERESVDFSILEKLQTSKAEISQDELIKILDENDFEYFKSKFNFLQEHRGFRPGKLHLLIGTPGSGKSTLTRSIVLEILEKVDTNIFLWLSEETIEEFKTSISKDAKGRKLDKLILFSEQNIEPGQFKKLGEAKSFFEEILKLNNPRFLVFDNITTSLFYMDRRPNVQSDISLWLKTIAEKLGIPFFLIAHTDAKSSDLNGRILDGNDIRGSKTIVNLVQYLYIFQRFLINNFPYPTLRIQKHRLHQVKNKMFYLVYSAEKNTYTGDKVISFKDFKEAYKSSDKL